LTYFDTHVSSEWYIKLLSNIDHIALGIGDKLPIFISTLLHVVVAAVLCLFIYWPLSLLLFLWMFFDVVIIGWLSKVNIEFITLHMKYSYF
jgi:ABC-type transport system involved in cytochrome bd biosynthesis fused ATPase/permease subunit